MDVTHQNVRHLVILDRDKAISQLDILDPDVCTQAKLDILHPEVSFCRHFAHGGLVTGYIRTRSFADGNLVRNVWVLNFRV